MTNRKIRWDFWTTVTMVIITLFALFLLYPLISLFLNGFKDTKTGVWIVDNYTRLSPKKYYKSALFNPFKLTFSVTMAAAILGVPLVYFMSFYEIKGKGALEVLFIISMMSPNLIGAYSWILLLGRSGIVTRLLRGLGIHMPSTYDFGGMLLVFALKLYPFIYMYASGALKKVDVALSEAAKSLEYRELKKALTVIMPSITPALIAAALLVFTNCTTDSGMPAPIDEGYHVIPTLVYSKFVGEIGSSTDFATCTTTTMVVVAATVFLFQRWHMNTKSFIMSSIRPIQPKEVYGIEGFFMYLLTHLLAATSIIPQYMVVYTSFRVAEMQMFIDGSSPESYREVSSTIIRSIKNTYLYCLAAIVTIVALGILIAYLVVWRENWLTNATDIIAMLPHIVPGSVSGITLLIAFGHLPIMLAGSAIVMVIPLVIRKQTYILRSSSAILYQISPNMEEAAIGLGDSPFMSFVKVAAKMMFLGITSGVILSQITLISELSSPTMLYTANMRTMPVAIYNEVIRTSYGTVVVLVAILTVITMVPLLIFFKVSGSKDMTVQVPYDELRTVVLYGVLELG